MSKRQQEVAHLYKFLIVDIDFMGLPILIFFGITEFTVFKYEQFFGHLPGPLS